MNKSSKMVSLFLSTALVFGTTACAPDQQVVYDQEGNPITIEEDDDDGFFGMFFAPFGFSKKHSGAIHPVKPSGITSGGSSYPNTGVPGSTNNKAGISGSSSSTSGGSSASSGITSGTHGGIGGGGSSAS